MNLLMTNFFIYRGLDKYMIQRIKAAESMNEEETSESTSEQNEGQQEEEPDEEGQRSENDEQGPLTEVPVGAK